MCGILNQHGDHPGLDGQFVGFDDESYENLFDDTYDAAKGPECEPGFVSIDEITEEYLHPNWVAMTQTDEENLDDDIGENVDHERHPWYSAAEADYQETVNALRDVHLEYVLLVTFSEEEYLKVTGCRSAEMSTTHDREELENLPMAASIYRGPEDLRPQSDPWFSDEGLCLGKITVHTTDGMKPKYRHYRRTNQCGRHGRKRTQPVHQRTQAFVSA